MAIKKHFIHCLLVLCIALQPAMGAFAIDVEHSDSTPVHSLDCDPVEAGFDDSCADTDCHTIAQSCGSQAGASYLPASAQSGNIPLAQINDLDRSDPAYRKNITDPIYRPPIA